MIEIRLCLPQTRDRIESQIIGERPFLMTLQHRHQRRMRCLVVRRQVDEKWNMYHIIEKWRSGVEMFHILPMVREIDKRL